jgi:hypothetical protein
MVMIMAVYNWNTQNMEVTAIKQRGGSTGQSGNKIRLNKISKLSPCEVLNM